MKRIILVLVALLSINFIQAENQGSPISLTLPQAEKVFFEQNLSLLAKHYEVDQAQAQIIQARLYDNPVISIDANALNRLNNKIFDFGARSEQTVQIEQKIRLAGQRNKRIALEKVNAEMAQYQYEEVVRTLHSQLNRQFVEIYFTQHTVKVYDQEITSLSKLIQVMAVQLSKGNASLMEKARLDAELLALKKEKNEADNLLISDRQELNLLLGLPATAIVIPQMDEQILYNLKIASVPFEAIDTLLTERSDLKLARAGIQGSNLNLKLQKSLAAPDFSVRGSYDRSGGVFNNFFSVGVGLSIPLFDRNQGNIKAAKYGLNQSRQESQEALSRAHSEVYSAYQQWKNALELYQSSDTTIEHNFSFLLNGVINNFCSRNINMLEFLDYYESYKNTYLQLCNTRKDVFLKMEAVNEAAGRSIFKY